MRKTMPAINITNINAIRPSYTANGPAAILQLAARGLSALSMMFDRSRQRRALARLDDRLLDDIGHSRSDAQSETAKPFWRP